MCVCIPIPIPTYTNIFTGISEWAKREKLIIQASDAINHTAK